MSLSARERRNPPPRRKSCAACIKAKRRCDAALPTCFRCAQRKLPCQYTNAVLRVAGSKQVANDDLPETWLTDSLGTACPHQASSVSGSSSTSPGSIGLDTSDDALTAATTTITSNIFYDEDLASISFLTAAIDEPPAHDTGSHSMVVAPPTTQQLDSTADVIRKRLQLAVDIFKSAPSMMVLENKTPWCHALLYKEYMPRSMQDAHASCALYMAKNRVNAPVIFRSIESRVCDLVSAPTPQTFLESLAHTQAFILYQIIRLLDGDIGSRSSGELLIPSLENSALHLLKFVSFQDELATISDMPLCPLQPTKAFWENWVLQESARRTVMITFYFIQAYRILASQKIADCDGKLGLCHSWTLSSWLWDAKTAVDFADAWRMGRYFVVTNAQFQQVLRDAKAEDVDEFGKMWISSLLGIEETEGWFAARGGRLRAETYKT